MGSLLEKPPKTAQGFMQNYNFDLLCVSKCRWTSSGREVSCCGSANLLAQILSGLILESNIFKSFLHCFGKS